MYFCFVLLCFYVEWQTLCLSFLKNKSLASVRMFRHNTSPSAPNIHTIEIQKLYHRRMTSRLRGFICQGGRFHFISFHVTSFLSFFPICVLPNRETGFCDGRWSETKPCSQIAHCLVGETNRQVLQSSVPSVLSLVQAEPMEQGDRKSWHVLRPSENGDCE